MPPFYLQVEAINLDSFVYDTNDISTIRGGGLGLLLDAQTEVEGALRKLPGPPQLTVATSGASRIVWRVENAEQDGAIEESRKALAAHDALRHATFAVETCLDEGRFREHTEALAAKTRWNQMRSPTLAFPSLTKTADQPCEDDQLRPATKEWRLPQDPNGERKVLRLSEATHARRRRGAHARQNLYKQVLGSGYAFGPDAFTDDLGTLSIDEARGNLNGKMAVFYADGNDFGGVQRDLCHTPEDQEKFDETVQRRNKDFLRTLLDRARADPGLNTAFGTTGSRMRLETLLWGGDEVMFVVPAWRGLHLARIFFEAMKGPTFEGINKEGNTDSRNLTHAAGLVFCNHKAPIARMRKLAIDLAERAKGATGRREPALAYQMLESFDHTGVDLGEYLHQCQPKAFSSDPWVLNPEGLWDILALASLKGELSRRKIHEISSYATRNALGGEKAKRENEAGMTRAPQADIGDRDKGLLRRGLAALHPPGPSEAADWHAWFALNELWDYIVDPPSGDSHSTGVS